MKPYYQDDAVTIYHGDCREILPTLGPVDLVLTDPPYGVTNLAWDKLIEGWLQRVRILPTGSMWMFGSLRFLMAMAPHLGKWKMAQDIIWAKHNGSNFHADRFRRIHELCAQFYQGAWGDTYKCPQYTQDATSRTVRRKARPAHMGNIGSSAYESHDGGPRLQHSIIKVRSCHGYAQVPTQKPIGIIEPLVRYSCPSGGTILDPFVGSGSTLAVSKALGRHAIGIDIEEKCCEIAASRLSRPLPVDEVIP
jgi:site-specific DNA-methyltransferase (adenine-specific)